MTIILGIDPGSRKTGAGIIERKGSKTAWLHHQVIHLESFDLPGRLNALFSQLNEVIQTFQPQEMAIEQVFMARNPDSALKLGHARGVAMLAGIHHGLTVHEYSARQVKQAVVGTGAAGKPQVQAMITRLLSLDQVPPTDAADALAIAVCHAHTDQNLLRLAGSKWRRGRVR